MLKIIKIPNELKTGSLEKLMDEQVTVRTLTNVCTESTHCPTHDCNGCILHVEDTTENGDPEEYHWTKKVDDEDFFNQLYSLELDISKYVLYYNTNHSLNYEAACLYRALLEAGATPADGLPDLDTIGMVMLFEDAEQLEKDQSNE